MSKPFETYKNEKYMEDKVNQLSNMLNVMGFDNQAFCEAFKHEHRTIQQAFTRLCLQWIMTCGMANYAYDERNKASHEVCRDIWLKAEVDKWNLPYI